MKEAMKLYEELMEDPNIPDYAAKKVERLYLLLSELCAWIFDPIAFCAVIFPILLVL